MKADINGIEMPEEFNCKIYNEVFITVHSLFNPQEPLPQTWIGFSSGWNAISFRYKSMSYHDEMFRRYLNEGGFEGRYLEERELFNFFVNGLSSLETFFYAIYNLGKFIDAGIFNDSVRQINPERTLQKFQLKFPDFSIEKFLSGLLDDGNYKELKEVRNALAHRIIPGRIIYASIGKEVNPPDNWKLKGLTIDEGLTYNRRRWLSQILSQAFEETLEFLKNDL